MFVIATQNNTDIYVDGVYKTVIQEGATYAVSIVNNFTFIKTSKPAYAYKVTGVGCEIGSTVLPTVSSCTGSTQLAFTRAHNNIFVLNLMARSGAQSSFKINGVTRNDLIPPASFSALGTSEWVAARFDLTGSITQGNPYLISNTQDVLQDRKSVV